MDNSRIDELKALLRKHLPESADHLVGLLDRSDPDKVPLTSDYLRLSAARILRLRERMLQQGLTPTHLLLPPPHSEQVFIAGQAFKGRNQYFPQTIFDIKIVFTYDVKAPYLVDGTIKAMQEGWVEWVWKAEMYYD